MSVANPEELCISTQKCEDAEASEQASDVYNWSRRHERIARADQLRYPVDENAVVALVQNAPGKIRTIGTGLTYEHIMSIAEEDGNSSVLISLRDMSGLTSHTDNTATFLGGTKLLSVFETLQSMDRMLPCSPGVIAEQTIAGAIATGTHGQGLYQCSIADVIDSLRMVLPDGSIFTCSHDHPSFGGFITSLGCLGVVVEVTVRTVPFKLFTCMKSTTNYDDLHENFITRNKESEFVKAWWFPMTDEVHLWEVNPANAEEQQKFKSGDGSLLALSEPSTQMNSTVELLQDRMEEHTKDFAHKGRQFETVARFKNATHVCGTVYQILCKGIPVPQVNLEIAVPLRLLPEVLEALRLWYKESNPALHYPFILRCTGASKAWLSPAYDRQVCYIGSLFYMDTNGQVKEGGMDVMYQIQQLLAQYEGVPHFGKHFVKELFDLPALLPKWTEFKQLRKRLDPSSKFENKFLAQLFS